MLWQDEAATDHYAFVITDSSNDSTGVTYSSAIPALNTWVWLCVTFDGGAQVVRLYLNAEEDANSPFSVSGVDNIKHLETFYIGNHNGFNKGFDGIIDEVSVWNRALSSDEIQAIYRFQRGAYGVVE